MSQKYPVEALLRPPVELWSALVALICAGVALLAPLAVMMTPDVAIATAALLLLLALRRGAQAWRVLHYQHHLRKLPRYRLPARKIPVSQRKLFLGKGFPWTQTHTQRLRDTLKPEAQRYLRMGPLFRWARRTEIAWEGKWGPRWLAQLLACDAWWNPLKPLPPVGGKPQLHAVEPDEQDVWMSLSERVGHTLVLGTTRVGKTRLAELLIAQDIRRGEVVIVFDPKGDPDLLRRVWTEARRAGRGKEFTLFHLGYPDISARYNAIGNFSRVTEIATRIANQLPSAGNSAAFKEFAWRFTNIIARALVALGRRPDYHQIRRYLNDIEPLLVDYCRQWLETEGPEGWRHAVKTIESAIDERQLPYALKGRSHRAIALIRYIEANQLYEPVADGLLSAFRYDRTYFDKIVSSVGPLMEKLTTGKIAELIAPDYFDLEDPRPIFDWLSVIRRRGVIYVGLDALSDTTVGSAVGNSMFADLTSVAGRLYKHGIDDGLPGQDAELPPVCLHCDEFNELIGDEFIPMLNKAGGANFQVTAYTQTWSDVEARIGSRAKAGQVAGNFNTLIMLRVKDQVTAEMLTSQLPQVEIVSLMQVSGATDSPEPGTGVDFGSRAEDRISVTEVPLIAPADVVALPKGQAFALLEGGHLWKLRMPLPDATDDPVMPDDLSALTAEMSRTYTTGERWWAEGKGTHAGDLMPALGG